MSQQTLAQRNQRVTEVIQVLCDANAVSNRCGFCGPTPVGVNYTNLLIALQLEYPATNWDTDLLDETLAYMRQRGIILFFNDTFYLNFNMVEVGNVEWAVLCPLVRQPKCCATTQFPKYPGCAKPAFMQDACSPCHVSNPADGCCPPLTPPPQ